MLLSQFPHPLPPRCVHSLFCPHLHLTSDETTANRGKWAPEPGAQMQKSKRELKAGSICSQIRMENSGHFEVRLVALLLVIRGPPPCSEHLLCPLLRHLVHSHWLRAKCLLALNIMPRGRHDFGLGCALLGRFLQLAKLLFCEADGSSCEMSLTK